MPQYPAIQKTIRKFVLNENGRISKSNLIKIGVLLGGAVGFIIEKNVAACTAHGSQAPVGYSGHNSGGDTDNAHSSCSGGTDSAHANLGHGSGWSHGNSPHASHTNTATDCIAHNNALSILTTPQGSATGTHTHGISPHSSTGVQNVPHYNSHCSSGYQAHVSGDVQNRDCLCHSSY